MFLFIIIFVLFFQFFSSSVNLLSMAFKKTLAQRLFNITKISSQNLTNCRISSSSVSVSKSESDISSEPGENGAFKRFIHKRTGLEPKQTGFKSELHQPNLMEKLKTMDNGRNRIRLDGLIIKTPAEKPAMPKEDGVSVSDVKKLLKVAQLEMVKSRLRESSKSCVTVSELIRICSEYCSDHDQAVKIVKMLDDSAAVIILGDVVFLRPEQENETLLFREKC
ncbi:hypothetical protein MtrunA17_Chr5g0403551 [Medicago truncatula]|uniref:Uncharacterized protein n=1 Tax=Medicago truncatula TaxID=3880 RepID=A0A396HLF6_MEDTR|nr:hypothetical protein MtrunA17_Chr5g0403551 [Medicago truncatula]